MFKKNHLAKFDKLDLWRAKSADTVSKKQKTEH